MIKPTALAQLEDVRAEVKRREALPHEIQAERAQVQGELLMARQRRHDAQQAAKGKLPAAEAEKLRGVVTNLERQLAEDWNERDHAARSVAAEAQTLERKYIDEHLDELVTELRGESERARDRLIAAIHELLDADRDYQDVTQAWRPILEALERRDGPALDTAARGALGTVAIDPRVEPSVQRRRYLNAHWLKYRDALAALAGSFDGDVPTPVPPRLDAPRAGRRVWPSTSAEADAA